MITVVLADDHAIVAEGLGALLRDKFSLLRTVHDGRALVAAAAELNPDVVVTDIGMPLLSGMNAGRELKKLMPRTRLIVLTMNEDPDVAREALRQWASAYLLKKSAGSELIKAVHEVLKGKSYVTPRIAQKLMDEFVRDPRAEHSKQLTPRQKEVLHLLAEGRTMRETAEVLHLTPRTVAFHKYRIMEEFGLKSNSDLVRFAIREKVVSPP